ncbi:MAG: histidine kinase [Saprospiraceae bacterium]|nr:histidine kinase [Saprospiraceae bacterium]
MSGPFKLLYVDDDEDNLLAFRAVFRRNYKIETALSAREALSYLEAQDFDLIISDQRMPGTTGTELLELVNAKYPGIIRMLMTGYSDMQATIDAINKGKIYQYISKPWNAGELKVIIDRALEVGRLKMRNRELEREQITAQFEVLKNQVNPHFLFNSLNILRSLISTDQEKAIEFTDKFSKLYRSMLMIRDQHLISVGEELEFVQRYLYLQKTRFSDSLQVKIDFSQHQLDHSIPPFSIQMMVENCIKHNIVSEEQPLTIEVKVENNHVLIINNLQLRNTSVRLSE